MGVLVQEKMPKNIVFCLKCPLDLCTDRGTSLQLVLVPVLLVQD